MTTRIAGSLPSDDKNGLHVVARALRERTKDTHVVIAVLGTKTLLTDVKTGDVSPTAEILAIEVINPDPSLDDLETAQRLLRRASERRHGGEMLPIPVEDELDALFKRVDREHLEEREAELARLRAEAETDEQRLEREEEEATEREQAQADADRETEGDDDAGEPSGDTGAGFPSESLEEDDGVTAGEVPDHVPDDWDTGPGAPLEAVDGRTDDEKRADGDTDHGPQFSG